MGHLDFSFNFIIFSSTSCSTCLAVFLNLILAVTHLLSKSSGAFSEHSFYCNFFLLLFLVCNNLHFWESSLVNLCFIFMFPASCFCFGVCLWGYRFSHICKILEECVAHRISSVKFQCCYLVNGLGKRREWWQKGKSLSVV